MKDIPSEVPQIRYSNTGFNNSPKIGFGSCHGTFGELLQGMLSNKKDFMVTFPINLFSNVIFYPIYQDTLITVTPKNKTKSVLLARLILNYFQVNIGGHLSINSQIPEGKGLASSSADLVATAYAIKKTLNIDLSSELITYFIAKIEPTDGVMYPGASAFYHKEVKLRATIADLPPIHVIAIDEGYKVDTLLYNNKQKLYGTYDCKKYEELLSQITKAIKSKNLREIGHVSTQSAIINQRYNYKKSLAKVINISNQLQALGVCVAHSGSFIGILLDPTGADIKQQKYYSVQKLSKLKDSVICFQSLAPNVRHSDKIINTSKIK